MENKSMTEDQILIATECLRCIAHPKRLRILEILENHSACVSEIVDQLKISQPVTSDHLRLMESRGILKAERVGRKVFYSLAMNELKIILDCIRHNKLKRG